MLQAVLLLLLLLLLLDLSCDRRKEQLFGGTLPHQTCTGLGFVVWGSGFGVWGLGFGVWGLGVANHVREVSGS